MRILDFQDFDTDPNPPNTISDGWTVYTVEAISAGGTITTDTTAGLQKRRVVGTPGAVTTANEPFGTGGGWKEGMIIKVFGTSSSFTVTMAHQDISMGVLLNGECVLGLYDSIDLQWDSVADRWIEITRMIS